MATKLNAYISFKDNARDAMEFYKSVFGGQLWMDTYEKFQASEDPAENNKIMHAYLVTERGLELMAADTPNGMEYQAPAGISLSLSGGDADADEDELKGYWEKLSDGGKVVMPLEKAPWGAWFGMVQDKFGIQWMVNIGGEQQA
jgi:PhnB protein